MVGRNENASGIPKLRHKLAEHANEGEAPGQGLWTPAGVTGTHGMSHTVRSLERHARPGVDAVAQHVAERDPAARRRR
jgi:integrase/recombinase XerD